MNPDTGQIKYGAIEKLGYEGFTEELSEEEASKLLKLPPEIRKETLAALREERARKLELDNKMKELAIGQLKVQSSGNQILMAKKRNGLFTKKSISHLKAKQKKKQVKKSRQKNRKKK